VHHTEEATCTLRSNLGSLGTTAQVKGSQDNLDSVASGCCTVAVDLAQT